MKKPWPLSGLLLIGLSPVFAATNYFCPDKNQTISVGMSAAQVTAACGDPLSKQKSRAPATKKVPVQQLIFNQAGTTKVFYGVWQIPHGNDHGNSLVVSVVDNKVVAIEMDGGSVSVSSVCEKESTFGTDASGGGSFAVGDPVSKVYAACGNPSNINNTFIQKALPGVEKPETWIYRFGEYQSPLQLKFQGGKLIEIKGSSE